MSITGTTLAGRRTAAGIGFTLAGGACLFTAAALSLDVTNARTDRGLAITVQLLCAVLPITLGVFRLLQLPEDRFARLLIATGLASSIATLAQSSDSTLYSIGRVTVWVVEVMIVYLLLSFPDGRLHSRRERQLFGGVVLVCGLLYLPSALLTEFPAPTPYSTCQTDCPANALLLVHGAGSFFDDVVRPLREVLTLLLFTGVAAAVGLRARRGAPLVKRILVPVAVVAAFRAVALGVYDALRASGETSATLRVVAVIFVLSL